MIQGRNKTFRFSSGMQFFVAAIFFLGTLFIITPGICDSLTRAERLEKFIDWRFGIFIHWGITSGYQDARNPILGIERITHSIGNRFDENATAFDAREWLRVIRQSGAKYLTFTTMHQPGFALFDTKYTDYKSKRDYTKEIASACREVGMPYFFYFPLDGEDFLNWTGWPSPPPGASPEGLDDWKIKMKKHHRRLTGQLNELCFKYKPFGIWLDRWPSITKKVKSYNLDPVELFDFQFITETVRKCDPNILIGNKHIFSPYIDFLESEYLFNDHFGNQLFGNTQPTEVCDVLPGSKWFSKYLEQRKFLNEKEIQQQTIFYIQRLISSAGRGLNYLLNMGPLPNGELQKVEVEILLGIGKWLKKNGEAVYGTRPGPLSVADWGYNVIKDQKIYLHILNNQDIWKAHGKGIQKKYRKFLKNGLPKDKKIVIRNFPGVPMKIHELNSSKPISFNYTTDYLKIDLSAMDSNSIDLIVVIELE